MRGKPLKIYGLPGPLPSDFNNMMIEPWETTTLLSDNRYSNIIIATPAEQKPVIEGVEGSDEPEDSEVTCEDLLYDIEITSYKAYKACFDINTFLNEQEASLEKNEEACIDGIISIAKKLGINDINRRDLLKEHSHYTHMEAIEKILEKIDTLKESCSTDEDNDHISASLTFIKMIAQKMMILKSSLAREINILIAYGTNFIKFEYSPYIILTIATARNKKATIQSIIVSYDQLYAIESLALLEMDYHVTKGKE